MQVKIALKAIFSRTERFLLRNNKVFVLDHLSSSDSSEHDIDEITLNQALEKSKSPFLRPLFRSTLKKGTKEIRHSRVEQSRSTNRNELNSQRQSAHDHITAKTRHRSKMKE